MQRLLLPLLLLLAAPASAQSGLAGDWSGTLDAGGQQLTLIIHLAEADGGLSATMDVPVQGAYGFPADAAGVAGDTLVVSFTNLNATFEGVLAEDGGAVEGTWTQGGHAFPLALTPYEAPAGEAAEAPKPEAKPERGDFSGDWAAALALPTGGEVRLTLHLTHTDDGYEAALTGPGGERQTLDTVSVSGHDVVLSNATPALEIVGTVSDDEATIEGEWRQGEQKLPVTFTRG